MTTSPHAVVEAVPSRLPSSGVSLVETALPGDGAIEVVYDDNGNTTKKVDRWAGGIKWRPYTDGGIGGAYDPCNVGTLTAGTPVAPQTNEAFAIWEADSCSAMGNERFVAAETAKILLEATTSKKIAKELWRGDIAKAQGWSNRRLSNPTALNNLGKINAGAAVNRIAAFAALEQSIGEQGSGATGYIHCTRRTAAFWASDHLIERVGNRLVSPLGTVIVADAGYDGSDSTGAFTAAGTTAWAYATGPVRVWVSDIEIQTSNQILPPLGIGPQDMNDLIGEGLARDTNLITVRAYRYALAAFDSTIHVGVLVDHTNATTNNAQTT
jgi:hypothetical protein